jgi:hypothetical protein
MRGRPSCLHAGDEGLLPPLRRPSNASEDEIPQTFSLYILKRVKNRFFPKRLVTQ